jgi:hypothetical protein
MNRKIIGICIMMLLIGTAVLPALGMINKKEDVFFSSIYGPNIEWEKTFGGDEFDWFYCIRQTNDGGYIATGTTEESDVHYAWLLKVDANGNEEWSKINTDINGYDSEMEQIMSDVKQTSDGGYIAGGIGNFYNEEYGYWFISGVLWKVDSNGETEWFKILYNHEDTEWTLFPWSILELDDGFIFGGMYYESFVADIAMFKTDEYGNIEWYKIFDLGGNDLSRSLCITDDDGYFLTGSTSAYQSGAFYMLKTDSEGNKQWDNIFDGAKSEYTVAKGCHQTDDGGYIMCGATKSYGVGNNDLWIVKADSSGNMEWNKTFGGSGNDRCYSMGATDDNGYVFCVSKDIGSSSDTMGDVWLIKTDDIGNADWKFLIEKEGIQHPSSMIITENGEYVVSGRTGDMNSKSADAFIVKVSSFENQRPNKPEIVGPSIGKPDREYTFTASCTDPDEDELFYLWDWGDGNYSELLDTNEALYSWSTEANFTVKVMAIDDDGGESDWSDPFEFSTPKNKLINPFLIRLIHRFPFLEILLNL